MVYVVCYDTELRVWWDRRDDKLENMKYKLTINNKNCVYTDSVYYNFKNLEQGKEYNFLVQVVDSNGNVIGKTETLNAKTLPKRKIVDITKPPYNAVGDGKTDNTKVIQQALNDNPFDSQLYVPMGVYVCDKLNFTGNMNIRLDVGAKLVYKGDRND